MSGSKNKTLTPENKYGLDSPVSSRGRGTTGGGGKTVDTETARSLMGSRLGVALHPKAMWMLNKPGCGHKDHDLDCLCDVVLKGKTPVLVDLPKDMMYSSVICEHMGYCAPWTTEKLLTMLGMCARAHDMLNTDNVRTGWTMNNKVTPEAKEFIRESIDSGVRNATVIRQVKEMFDIEISQSYISKRRYIYNGTKGSNK